MSVCTVLFQLVAVAVVDQERLKTLQWVIFPSSGQCFDFQLTFLYCWLCDRTGIWTVKTWANYPRRFFQNKWKWEWKGMKKDNRKRSEVQEWRWEWKGNRGRGRKKRNYPTINPIYTVSQESSHLVTLQTLTDVQNFCTAGKRMKFATKLYNTTHLTLGMLLHYLGKLKIQILCEYSAGIWKKVQTNCILSAPVVCRLSDEATKNNFLSLKNTKSVADCGKFWSTSLARFKHSWNISHASPYK